MVFKLLASLPSILNGSSLELFLKRTHVDVERPGTGVLVRDVPVRVRDCGWLEKVLFFELGETRSDGWHIDGPIDVDPCNVNSLGSKVARQHLGEASHREFSRSEGGRGRKRFDSSSRPSEQNHSVLLPEHHRHDVLSGKKCAEGAHAPRVL